MPARLGVTVALEDSDLTRALICGYVSAADVAVTPLLVDTEERHERMIARREFDVCEFSISQYLALRGKGGSGFTAIPVFPRRMFGQRFVFCRADAAIAKPEDLRGKRVAISRYQNSLALWLRGYLQHEYGVPPSAIEWVRVREEALEFALPADVRLRQAPPGSTVDTLLANGEIDGIMVPSIPAAFLEGAPFIKRVFPDVKRVEVEYFKRTRDFPIMHTVVIRDEILDEHPWAAESIRRLFEESKRWYFAYAGQPFRLGQVFGSLAREEEHAVMGPDPWPYTVADNAVSLRILAAYAHEQGLTARPAEIETLFPTLPL